MQFTINRKLFIAFLEEVNNLQISNLPKASDLTSDTDKLRYLANDYIYTLTQERGILKKDKENNFEIEFKKNDFFVEYNFEPELKIEKEKKLYEYVKLLVSNFIASNDLIYNVSYEIRKLNVVYKLDQEKI
ncbi:hypothetical protein COBT_002280 [Conglomerata obtusa]